jgi:uncharacterized protein involved in cysteine biosynthesis
MSDMRPHRVAAIFREFFAGFRSPLDGARYMNRHPKLWRYGAMPTVLNLAITLLVLVLFLSMVAGIAVYLHPRFPEGALGVLWEVLAILSMLLVVAGLSAATWVLLNGILTGYFYSRLAEAVELQLGMSPDEIHEVSFRYQVIDALCDFALLVLINTGLLMLNCVPLFGSVVAVCGAFYLNCHVFGRDFFDHPLALRGMRRKEKRAFCKRHRWHTFGLGAISLLLGLVPLLGAFVLTTAATGAVLLHRDLRSEDPVERRIEGSQDAGAAPPLKG